MKSIFVMSLLAVMGLSGCSSTYASKQACERELARQRGSVAGVLVGGAFGDGLGSALGSVAGNFAGAEAGELLYNQGEKTADDHRPYKKNFISGCNPA